MPYLTESILDDEGLGWRSINRTKDELLRLVADEQKFVPWTRDIARDRVATVSLPVQGNKVLFTLFVNNSAVSRVPGTVDSLYDFRIFSEWLPSMQRALFGRAKITDLGPPIDEYQFPLDVDTWLEKFPPPAALEEGQADALVRLIQESPEHQVVTAALGIVAMARLWSNHKQRRLVRRIITSILQGRITFPGARALEMEQLQKTLSIFGCVLVTRLTLTEPWDWTPYQLATIIEFDESRPRTLVQNLQILWRLVCAVALRPKEERMDSEDLFSMVETEIADMTKLGLKMFFESKLQVKSREVQRSYLDMAGPLLPPIASVSDALRCRLCLSQFSRDNSPVSFFDGTSTCRRCVPEKRKRVAQAEQLFLRGDEPVNELLSNIFGGSLDKTLQDVIQGVEVKDQNQGISPSSTQLKMNGNSAYRNGLLEKAVELYSEAISQDRANPVIYSNRASVYAKLGMLENGLTDAVTALSLSDGAWARPHFRIFENFAFKNTSYTNAIPLEDRALNGEVKEQAMRERFERWFEHPDITIFSVASLARAHAMGERVERSYEHHVLALLLADCAQFDLALAQKDTMTAQEVRMVIRKLQASSLILGLAAEVVNCYMLRSHIDPIVLTGQVEAVNLNPSDGKSGAQLTRQSSGEIKRAQEIRLRDCLEQGASDLDCPLCISLLYEPVTMPCGHSFCRTCALRALDNSSDSYQVKCPSCRADFGNLLAALEHAPFSYSSERYAELMGSYMLERIRPNRALTSIIEMVFPDKLKARVIQADEDESLIPANLLAKLPQLDQDISCEDVIPIVNAETHPLPWIGFDHESVVIGTAPARLMLRRLVLNRCTKDTLRTQDRQGTLGISTFDGVPLGVSPSGVGAWPSKRWGVVMDLKRTHLLQPGEPALVAHGVCVRRFEILDIQSKDGYEVAKVRYFEEGTDTIGNGLLIEEFTSESSMLPGLVTDPHLLALTEEQLMVQAARFFNFLKIKYNAEVRSIPVNKFLVEHLPYYIARILRFPQLAFEYMMFGDATQKSFKERLRFALCMSKPNADKWDNSAGAEKLLPPQIFPEYDALVQRAGSQTTRGTRYPFFFGDGGNGNHDDENDDAEDDDDDDHDEADIQGYYDSDGEFHSFYD